MNEQLAPNRILFVFSERVVQRLHACVIAKRIVKFMIRTPDSSKYPLILI